MIDRNNKAVSCSRQDITIDIFTWDKTYCGLSLWNCINFAKCPPSKCISCACGSCKLHYYMHFTAPSWMSNNYTLFCRMEAHTWRLRGVNIGLLNLVMYSDKTITNNTTINELTKGLLAQQDKSSILLAYNCNLVCCKCLIFYSITYFRVELNWQQDVVNAATIMSFLTST